jgi:diguanylate cyclase
VTIYFPADVQLASHYVKQAIPLMVKNGIAPNPCNFTLWFTYVTNRDQELKNVLDRMLEERKGFPEDTCRNLFKKYVMKEDVDLQDGLQASLTSVLHELVGSVEKAKDGADDYQRSLEESLECVSGDLTNSSLEDTIKLLIQTTQTIKLVTNGFQDQLKSAENEIMELRRMLHEEERRTYIDPLTQIGNRRAFDKRMVELFQKEERYISMVLVDLDYFKELNDTYGHLMGDKVLQSVGKTLQKACPENALVARYGGEEFVLLLEDSQEVACHIAETIRISLIKMILKKKNTGQIVDNVTASFGVAQKIEGEFPDQLIERADKALYAAKENGRNRVQVASSS